MFTYANAPAAGEGVGVQLPGQNNGVSTEKTAQIQALSSRLGMSPLRAALVLDLLRDEPWRSGAL